MSRPTGKQIIQQLNLKGYLTSFNNGSNQPDSTLKNSQAYTAKGKNDRSEKLIEISKKLSVKE
jgi:hypothetical protein